MKIYNIKDEYIQYLRLYDKKVEENKKEKRPYVGIVLEVNQYKYFVPMASPKKKHSTMKNGKDFRKINGGEYGAINFNLMIPVVNEALILVDINNLPDQKYRRLLQNQYKCLRTDEETIINTANKLYKLCEKETVKLTEYDKKIKERCCDFKLLEQLSNTYKGLEEVAATNSL